MSQEEKLQITDIPERFDRLLSRAHFLCAVVGQGTDGYWEEAQRGMMMCVDDLIDRIEECRDTCERYSSHMADKVKRAEAEATEQHSSALAAETDNPVPEGST
ncbi:MAG: hypothetical protein HQL53_12085, partial [Magnetococcales bacterium]|nr:hypothetical protein [Magnetococcales bacterium]